MKLSKNGTLFTVKLSISAVSALTLNHGCTIVGDLNILSDS